MQLFSPIHRSFDFAFYSCRINYTLKSAADVNSGITSDGRFQVRCNLFGSFGNVTNWPTCILDPLPTISFVSGSNQSSIVSRKRRSDPGGPARGSGPAASPAQGRGNSHLYSDVQYSLYALVETQFVFSTEMAEELKVSKNTTLGQSGFALAIVDRFHERIIDAFDPRGQVDDFQLRYPIVPLCEQPTGFPAGHPTNCVPVGGNFNGALR